MAPQALTNCLAVTGQFTALNLIAPSEADSRNNEFDLNDIRAVLSEQNRADDGLDTRTVEYYFKFFYNINGNISTSAGGDTSHDGALQPAQSSSGHSLDDIWQMTQFSVSGPMGASEFDNDRYRLPAANLQTLLVSAIEVKNLSNVTIGEYKINLSVSSGYDGVMSAFVTLVSGSDSTFPSMNNGTTTTSVAENPATAQILYFDTEAQKDAYQPGHPGGQVPADHSDYRDKLVASVTREDVLLEITGGLGQTKLNRIAELYNNVALFNRSIVTAKVSDAVGQNNPIAQHARNKGVAVGNRNVFAEGEKIVLSTGRLFEPKITMAGSSREIDMIASGDANRRVYAVVVQQASAGGHNTGDDGNDDLPRDDLPHDHPLKQVPGTIEP